METEDEEGNVIKKKIYLNKNDKALFIFFIINMTEICKLRKKFPGIPKNCRYPSSTGSKSRSTTAVRKSPRKRPLSSTKKPIAKKRKTASTPKKKTKTKSASVGIAQRTRAAERRRA